VEQFIKKGLVDESAALDGLASLAQPTRLATVRRLLAAYPGSLAAGELAKACDTPHNTMSTHLGILMRAGLVEVERAGRTMNYRVDVAAFRSLVMFLTRDCCGNRPELCGDIANLLPQESSLATEDVVSPAFNVLFLCTRNSARSIIAEAVMARLGKGRFNAYSAGSDPADRPMPEVIERLDKLGHDVSKLRSKSWDEFTGPNAPRMDFVIALCDSPQGQMCPDLGEKFVTAAWPLPDPADFRGSPVERTTLLNELYAMARRRIEIFTSLPFDKLDRMALKKRLDEIGDTVRMAP
jgi:ArsR family transcriptional regulator, arsenate/arsenite/antimonite-responsive transcriptional repressor / arsenate reductase (thioredoxin)